MTINENRNERDENIIMIAEDDMFMRSLAKAAIEGLGTIVEAENAKNVMPQYIKYKPDILFLDIHLPGGDGLQILEEILEYDEDAHIVILSADSNEENIKFTSQKGAQGFITKPFTKEKMIETIKACPTYK